MTSIADRLRRSTLPLLPAAALALLAGCASATPIGELLDNASRYNGKTVRIEGEVRGSVGSLESPWRHHATLRRLR